MDNFSLNLSLSDFVQMCEGNEISAGSCRVVSALDASLAFAFSVSSQIKPQISIQLFGTLKAGHIHF